MSTGYDPALEMMRRRRTRDMFISSSTERTTSADTSDLVAALSAVTELAQLQSATIASVSDRVSVLEEFVRGVAEVKIAS